MVEKIELSFIFHIIILTNKIYFAKSFRGCAFLIRGEYKKVMKKEIIKIQNILSVKKTINKITILPISRLNSLNKKLEDIADLELENENLNTLNVKLERKIDSLIREKKDIKDKDAILLAKTITAMNVQEKHTTQQPPEKKIAELDIGQTVGD